MDKLMLMAAAGITALFGFGADTSNSAKILQNILGSTTSAVIVDPTYNFTGNSQNFQGQNGLEFDDTQSGKRGWGFFSDTSKFPCIGSAVAAREQQLLLAHSTNSYMVGWAYQVRSEALVAAYSEPSASLMRSAVKDAWKAFELSFRLADKNLKEEQRSAWLQYTLAVKACGGSSASTSDVRIAGSSVGSVGGAGAPGSVGGYSADGSYTGSYSEGAGSSGSNGNNSSASSGQSNADNGGGVGSGSGLGDPGGSGQSGNGVGGGTAGADTTGGSDTAGI